MHTGADARRRADTPYELAVTDVPPADSRECAALRSVVSFMVVCTSISCVFSDVHLYQLCFQ